MIAILWCLEALNTNIARAQLAQQSTCVCPQQLAMSNISQLSGSRVTAFCRADRIFSGFELLWGGEMAPNNMLLVLQAKKIVGYAGLETCEGPDLIQVCLPL